MRSTVSVGLYVPVEHSDHENTIEPNGRQQLPSIDTDLNDRIHGGLGSRISAIVVDNRE